ncbi:MAG: hypothetical protein AAGJ46_14435 [Planctomycetota bacterium]
MGEYANHSVVIHTVDTGSAVALGGIGSTSANPNNQTVSDQGGQLHDTLRALAKQEPTQEFSTTSVATALAAVSPDGVCINSDGTHPGVGVFFEQKQQCGGAVVGASDHAQFLYDMGLLTPQTLSASGRDADVTLSMMVDALTDGTNEPVQRDWAATLPTGVDTSQFVLGAAKCRNLLLTDIRSLNIDFGIEKTEKRPQLGGVWPETVGVLKARPSATLTAKEIKYLRDTTTSDDASRYPMNGDVAEHADTIFYFKKRKNRAAFEDDAETVHFSITMAGLLVPENLFNASGTATGDSSWKIETVNDGTNNPLIVTTDIAYNPAP